jgi:hypothetical protein
MINVQLLFSVDGVIFLGKKHSRRDKERRHDWFAF